MILDARTLQGCRGCFGWRWRRTSIVVATFAALLGGPCRAVRAQEKPSLTANWSDANHTRYRQDVCQRYNVSDNRDVGFRTALRGLSLRPVLLIDQYFQPDDGNGGAINPDNPGMLVMLLDELAARAKFTWRDSFAVTEGPDEGMTWDDILYKGVDYFDFFASWYDTSVIERLNLGVTFPKGWIDSSFILVGRRADETVKVNLLNWLEPFQNGVWLLLVATIFWSAIVNIIIEATTKGRGGRSLRQWLSDSLYRSTIMFDVEGDDDSPDTTATRILSFSFTMWAFLLGSAYTANLASFFVEERHLERAVNSIDEAVAAGVAICNWEDTLQDTYISKYYPTAQQIKYKTEDGMYRGLMAGECVVAVTSVASLDLFQRDSSINYDCSLEQVGHVFVFEEAGLAMQADVGKLCTTLIRDVINLHMMEMVSDGTLQRLWDTHISMNTDLNCLLETAGNGGDSDDDQDELSLSVYEMAGTFCMHFVMTVLALLFAFVRLYRKRRRGSPLHVVDPVDLSHKESKEMEAPEGRPDSTMRTAFEGASETGHGDSPDTAAAAKTTENDRYIVLERQVEEMKRELTDIKTILSLIHDKMFNSTDGEGYPIIPSKQ